MIRFAESVNSRSLSRLSPALLAPKPKSLARSNKTRTGCSGSNASSAEDPPICGRQAYTAPGSLLSGAVIARCGGIISDTTTQVPKQLVGPHSTFRQPKGLKRYGAWWHRTPPIPSSRGERGAIMTRLVILSLLLLGGCAAGTNFTPRTTQGAVCKQQCALQMNRCFGSSYTCDRAASTCMAACQDLDHLPTAR